MARAIVVSAWALACAATLAANAATSAATAAAASNQRSVICGGVGSDARAQLESAASDANLELEFFAGRRGAYIADVDVTLTPVNGGAAFSTTADGPLCFAHLAPGRYQVEANYKGAKRLASATVGSKGRAHIAMGFPESVAEPDPGPVSAEEKRQASTQ